MKSTNCIRNLLLLGLAAGACLTLSSAAQAAAGPTQTIQVSGAIEETHLEQNTTPNGISYTASDILTGSLAGTAVVHIFSSEVVGNTVVALSKRIVFTDQGNLVLDEVGVLEGGTVSAISTITGGTGAYKNASGVLLLQGQLLPDGVSFTYSGTVLLQN